MWPAPHAEQHPDKAAYVLAVSGETVTYRDLDDESNRLAQLLYARGLRFGDHLAIFMENNERYLQACWAAQRSGLYFTPVNYHFNAEEVAYIVEDCDAAGLVTPRALRATAAELVSLLPDRVATRLLVGGSTVDGYERYDDAVAAHPA